MPVALTRPVSKSIDRCELTHLARTPIDPGRAAAQHEQYERTLRAIGCAIDQVEPADDLPDSVFVEDIVVVLDELAILTRPGAPSRRGETAGVERAIAKYRKVQRMTAPATMDGGDVLRMGKTIYIGISSRTNDDAARQLAAAAAPFGYTVECVRVSGCLHLKSAATAVGDGILLCNPQWVDGRVFRGCDVIAVDPLEPFAGNVLRVGGAIVCAAAFPRTADTLRSRGCDVHAVDVSELAKAEAGVTCCSVIVS